MEHTYPVETGNLLSLQAEHDLAMLEYGTVATSSSTRLPSNTDSADIDPEAYLQWTHVKNELVWLIRSATPIVISSTSQLLIMVPLLAAVGRLGTVALASMNLAGLYAGLCGVTPLAGIAMALDTFCSQSFTATKDKRILGVLLQRALLIGLAIMTLIYPLWWYSKYVFEMFGVPEEVAEVTGRLLRIYFFGIALLISYEFLRSFLFAQGIRKFALIAQSIGLAVGWTLTWLLVGNPSTSVGIIGVAFVVLGVAGTFSAVTIFYIAKVDGYQCWGGWSRAALRDWMPLLKLSVAGAIVSFLETLSVSSIDLASMFMGAQTMAAQAVLSMLMTSTWVMGTGFSVAACNRVGNHLGSGLPNRAKLAVLAATLLSAIAFGALALVFICYRTSLPYIFSEDGEVIEILATHIPWAAIAGAMQGINMALNGVLRGQGRQKMIAQIRFLSFVLVGVPVSVLAIFVFKWMLAGLWLGLVVCLATVLAIQINVIMTTDWAKEVIACQKRVTATVNTSHEVDAVLDNGENAEPLL
ncbi:ethionine resistance protein [Linderina macrospora]|uniref:Ethionine resistance protein n=1 Tax=Linderina macrospora TaxID=4868 RepID=A0ACC1JFH3_9FUNG|nr:ethionine resistance protein [Linderina macrospora]